MASEGEFQQPSKLLELFKINPIADALCLYLGTAGLFVLCRVSKELYRFNNDLRKSRWNINVRLRDYVSKPEIFRSQLGKYDALISGGFALNFFELVPWKMSNLDVFVKGGAQTERFIDYIQEHEGYKTIQEKNLTVETVRILFISRYEVYMYLPLII